MKGAAAVLGSNCPTHPLHQQLYPSSKLPPPPSGRSSMYLQEHEANTGLPGILSPSHVHHPHAKPLQCCALFQVRLPALLGIPHSGHHWAQWEPPCSTSTCCSRNSCSPCTSEHHAGSEQVLVRHVSMVMPLQPSAHDCPCEKPPSSFHQTPGSSLGLSPGIPSQLPQTHLYVSQGQPSGKP